MPVSHDERAGRLLLRRERGTEPAEVPDEGGLSVGGRLLGRSWLEQLGDAAAQSAAGGGIPNQGRDTRSRDVPYAVQHRLAAADSQYRSVGAIPRNVRT